jgi:hypothetical protein
VAATPQESLLARAVENASLEAQLEQREAAKSDLGAARLVYDEQHGAVKAALEGLNLATGEQVRIGRFTIERRRVAAKSVSFETKSTTRLKIGVDFNETAIEAGE